jgi:hypothetical protein
MAETLRRLRPVRGPVRDRGERSIPARKDGAIHPNDLAVFGGCAAGVVQYASWTGRPANLAAARNGEVWAHFLLANRTTHRRR